MEYLAGVVVQLAMALDPTYIALVGDVDWTWTDDDEHWITVFSTAPLGFDASSPSKFDADAAAPIREQEGEEGRVRLWGSAVRLGEQEGEKGRWRRELRGKIDTRCR
jgi:hypothetical protein